MLFKEATDQAIGSGHSTHLFQVVTRGHLSKRLSTGAEEHDANIGYASIWIQLKSTIFSGCMLQQTSNDRSLQCSWQQAV